LRIAFVSPNYLPLIGGTQIAMHNIATRLIAAGHDVTVVTRRGPGDKYIDHYEEVGVRSFVEFGGKASFVYSTFALYPFLNRHVVEADLIHQFHLLRFGFPVTLFAMRHGKPVVTTLMGTDTFDPEYPSKKLLAPFLAFIMNRSSAVTSPSTALSRYAYSQGCRNYVHIIPHGVDTDRFKSENWDIKRLREMLLRGRNKIILSVGRLHSIKRPDVLIRAMSILIHSYEWTNAVLVIAGDGPEELGLKRLVNDLDIAPFVEFRGHIPRQQVADYYHACDIFAFHSTFETFGIVLAEAMACAKAVVSTTAGAIPEIVEDGETGLLVPPNDPNAFASALLTLLKDPPLARLMGERGKKKALVRYEWGALCQQYIDLYRDVLKKTCAE
jgi:glycosyltransferase involved in cell wall biosynthesis